jgi:predicted RNase H-like HicB family nuclease
MFTQCECGDGARSIPVLSVDLRQEFGCKLRVPILYTNPRQYAKEEVMEKYRFQVIIEQDEDGLYVADVPALQGCHTQGRTFEEALENIREVIAMCVQELREEGKTIEPHYPEVVGIKTVEIAV